MAASTIHTKQTQLFLSSPPLSPPSTSQSSLCQCLEPTKLSSVRDLEDLPATRHGQSLVTALFVSGFVCYHASSVIFHPRENT
ncbi:hypothetical protein NXS19_008778 [Fusarium pseudograminearum]|nr:hypothetical protein NXS19_008778 [Fusarium pseudograminearum]